jgi:hypothetical protein
MPIDKETPEKAIQRVLAPLQETALALMNVV